MRRNDSEGYLCKYLEGKIIRASSAQFSYSNFVTYGGKAPMFSLCVGAIHLTSCVKVQKYLLYRDFRKDGR